jgi:hypothetical protein
VAIKAQWERLKSFFDTWFKTTGGQFLAAFQDFASTDDFAIKLEDCLRQWLAKRGFTAEGAVWDRVLDGSPFPGLGPFDASRERVFFGRELATAHAAARLREAGARGTPFLLVIGASGSGKSSFLRAGLVPYLTRPGTVPEIDLWRSALVLPGGDPLVSLAEALFAKAGLGPELRQGTFPTAQALAGLLAGNPDTAVAPIRKAIEQAAESRATQAKFETSRPARLLLAIDQAERLFLEANPEDAGAFAAIVAALIRHQLAYVIVALRSDAYPRFQLSGAFRDLRDAGATFDLVPPASGELEEIVTRPVAACHPSLAFEVKDGRALASVLVEDAEGGDALPLLQMTLSRLFDSETVRGDGVLRFTDYPGMDAAVTKTAQEALAILDEDARAQVPALITALVRDVVVDPLTGVPLPVVGALDRGIFEKSRPLRTALINAFVAHRLLTVEADKSAIRVRPVHEALLRIWPEAVKIIAENASLIRVRHTLEPIVREWEVATGTEQKRHLEISPALLDGAQQLAIRFGEDLPGAMREFIAQSLAVDAARRDRERRRQRKVLAATFAVLVIVAGFAGGSVWQWRNAEAERVAAEQAKQDAQAQRDEADQAKLSAQRQRDRAQTTESRFLADRARQRRTAGDAGTALLLALEGVPDDTAGIARPYVPEAELQLDLAWFALRERLIFFGHENYVHSAAFSPDGKRIVTASSDKTARLWDAETGKQIGAPLVGHEAAVDSAAFSPDGKRIVTASWDKTARLWAVFATTQQLVSAAKAAVSRCLTAGQRTTFFLLPKPPVWCIEMEKWPYQTAAWKQWLVDTRAGKNPPLPNAP